ncbi:MAG: hypothetical protein K6E91_05960 [Butyrivibrio sp.]|nr:hypothetical protein [Butyrivibrio sp.]
MLYEFEIGNREKRRLKNLIPEIYRDELLRDELFGIATFDRKTDVDNLVGITLVRVKSDFQEIVWVALTDNYSIPEYGADLIRCRVEAAQEVGALLGTFSDIPESEIEMQKYYRLAGFDIMKFEDDNSYVRAVKLRDERKAHYLLRKLTPLKA